LSKLIACLACWLNNGYGTTRILQYNTYNSVKLTSSPNVNFALQVVDYTPMTTPNCESHQIYTIYLANTIMF